MPFVFPLVCLGKPEGVSGVLSLQTVSVHGGWKLPLLPEPKPVLPQFPHKEPVPVPLWMGKPAAWLVFLYEWYLHDVGNLPAALQ